MNSSGLIQRLVSWGDQDPSRLPTFAKCALYLVRILLITAREYKANDISLRSSALTYAILLSLVPMLAMTTAVIKGMGGGDQLRQAAYNYISTLEESSASLPHLQQSEQLPSPKTEQPQNRGMTGHLRSAVDQLFDYVDRTNFAALGTFGILGILLSVMLVLSQIEGALNHIWKVENGRPLLRRLTDYLALLVLLPISINVAFASSAFLQNRKLSGWMDMVIPFDWLQSLLLKPIPIIIIGLSFYTIYIFFPNTRVQNRYALIGALLASICWFSIQNLYISLQVGVAKYNAIYGSFATFPLFLIWIYLGWIFILLGSQLAWVLQHLSTYRLTAVPSLPTRELACAYDLISELRKSIDENIPITKTKLQSNLTPLYTGSEITRVLEKLTANQLVHKSEQDDRLLLSTLTRNTLYDSARDAILGSSYPNSEGGKLAQKTLRADEI